MNIIESVFSTLVYIDCEKLNVHCMCVHIHIELVCVCVAVRMCPLIFYIPVAYVCTILYLKNLHVRIVM